MGETAEPATPVVVPVSADAVLAVMVEDYVHARRRGQDCPTVGRRAEISVAYLSGAAHMMIVALMKARGVDEESAAEILGDMVTDYSLNRWG